MSAFLPFSPPAVDDAEVEAAAAAIRSGWLSTGPRVKELQAAFAKHIGARAALAVNSCTSALHLALLALDIGPGDEVITSPITFAATANVIDHVGARPVFADVSPDTLCIDPERVREQITPRTKVILPVHYAGHPCDMAPLRELAAARGLQIVEDAAHSLPATYRGATVGSGDDLCCFSFYATKNLTTGEGGMLTGDPALVEKAQILSLHGMDRDAWRRYEKGGSWRYDIVAPGWKYNLSDVSAAMGLVQLGKLDRFQRRRREIVDAYRRALGDEPTLELPTERPDATSALHLYPLRLHLDRLTIDRDEFIVQMTARGIGTSVHFIPVHSFSYYRRRYGYKPEDLPVAWREFHRLVSLPLHPGLSDEDVARVASAVVDIVRKASR